MSDLRTELLSIREDKGRLTAALVVEAARPADAPLHGRFTWDDTAAAERYRILQAGKLIRSVRVTFNRRDPAMGRGRVREFISVTRPTDFENPDPAFAEQQRVYESIDVIVQDPVARAVVLNQMNREWRGFMTRYQQFDEFWRMVVGDFPENED
jgi:hypothetical protein